MSMYSSRNFNSYQITKEQYNYLLPIYGRCSKDNGFSHECFIAERKEGCFFYGTETDHEDMLTRIQYLD